MSAARALTVTLHPERAGPTPAAEVALTCVVANGGDRPEPLHRVQAAAAALVLEVVDPAGRRVPLRPPDTPRPEDGEHGASLGPGDSLTFRFAGFLDRAQPPGRYRVRYRGGHPPLGAVDGEPLLSSWLDVEVAALPDAPAQPAPLPPLRPRQHWWRRLARAAACPVRRLAGRDRCERLLTRNVDEALTEEISGAPPGFEAWNGTYAWRSRFRVRVDDARCRVIVTVRVRVVGDIDVAQRDAWERAIEQAWGGRAMLLCGCCCRGGYTIAANLVFVDSGEDYVVHAGPDTASLGIWGRSDAATLADEFGRMIGARDEYYTVDGTAWPSPFSDGAGVMNNPAEPPAPRHFELAQRAAEDLLGAACRVRLRRRQG